MKYFKYLFSSYKAKQYLCTEFTHVKSPVSWHLVETELLKLMTNLRTSLRRSIRHIGVSSGIVLTPERKIPGWSYFTLSQCRMIVSHDFVFKLYLDIWKCNQLHVICHSFETKSLIKANNSVYMRVAHTGFDM